MKALADAQAALKKVGASASKPDNGGNGSAKPSGSSKPAANNGKSESQDDGQSDLAKTGASVAAVVGVLVLLVVFGAGLRVMKSRR